MKSFDYIEQLFLKDSNNKLGDKNNFMISIDGVSFTGSNQTDVTSSKDLKIELKDKIEQTDSVKLIYDISGKDVWMSAEVLYEFFDTSGAVKQTVSVKNTGDCEISLTRISSAFVSGLGSDGLLPWHSDERFTVHYSNMAWQGEAQWKHATFSDLGLYPTTVHTNKQYFSLSSKGSWSTAKNYPMMILEDKETGRSFYFEVEPSGSWEMNIFNLNNRYAGDGSIAVEANCANINNDGWFMSLKAGEEYTAASCVYGFVDGGFEEAIHELIAYKRETNLAFCPDNKALVAYNTYMNGIWLQQKENRLIPLIDAAAELGIEIFCIDAGWFIGSDDFSKLQIGDYEIDKNNFPEYGLEGIIKYIKEKGMRAGVWFELESCAESGGPAYTMSPNCLCRRNGKVLGGKRAFFDMRDSAVREHLHRVIDMVCDMGVSFIKNDYNQATGIGFGNDEGSLATEYPECLDAFLSFCDEVRQKHPDLIIENCASGAMRADNNVLKHFELGNSSDQELYYRYSSIASGSIALAAPEKVGIWAYPYPCLSFEQGMGENEEFWAKKSEQFRDGEETVFNMVNSLLGSIYMSGRIDRCDDYNTSLIKEAIEYFKKNRNFLFKALPIWPMGTFNINQEGVFCTGLINREEGKIILAVWNINAHKKTAVIDMSKYLNCKSTVKIAYPDLDTKAKVIFNSANKKLSVQLPDNRYSARIIEINI